MATHPCKCGYLGDPRHECRCSPGEIQRYRARISGPLLDRIDIHIEAPALSLAELRNEKLGEPSAPLRDRVQAARLRQHRRFSGTKVTANARMRSTAPYSIKAGGAGKSARFRRGQRHLWHPGTDIS